MGDDLDDANDGEGSGVDDGPDAGGAEMGAGAAEEIGVRVELAELGDDEGGVEIARGFAGGDEDFERHLDLV
jgi:hypothetical protein